MKERYCPKAECYYHGYDGTCPEHRIKTKKCRTPKELLLTEKSAHKGRGGGIDKPTQEYMLHNDKYIYLEDGTYIDEHFQTNPQNKIVDPKSITRHYKPEKTVILSREGYDKDDKLGYFRHYNHSEQLGYECFGEHVNGFYIVTKTYPIRTTIWYSEIESSIKENDVFWYGGFDAHEEGTGDKEDYYG